MSDSLRPHELQPAKPPCASPTPGAYPNSYPLSWGCHPTISSCHPLLLLPSIFPIIRVFSNESALHKRWPKYWSFSISPSNEYSGFISFRMDWFDLFVVKGLSRVFSSLSFLLPQVIFGFGSEPSMFFPKNVIMRGVNFLLPSWYIFDTISL